MESISRDFISEFEKDRINKITEKKNFEREIRADNYVRVKPITSEGALASCVKSLLDLTEEEIKDKITNIKKNCFLLQLKNEVFENYLKRHDFGALRELQKFLKKEFSKSSFEDGLFEEDEKTTTLKSNEFSDRTMEISDATEQENVGFLIKVVEQEISELCLKSKALKKVYDKKIVYLTGEMESYSSQVKILEKIYNLMNQKYPEDLKFHSKDKKARSLELLKFMEEMIQNIKVQMRKASIASNNIKQEYTNLCRNEYIEDHPVSSSDIKLLEIENEKLEIELSKENQVYMDLTHLRSNYEIKLKKQKSNLLKLNDRKKTLESDLKSYQKRLLSLDKYRQRLNNEVTQLEAEKQRLIQLRQFAFDVPTPKQYIEENEKYKKKLKGKKGL